MESNVKPTVVKNKRLKISPHGMITLPVAARKSLKMEKGKGRRVSIAIKDRQIALQGANQTGGYRVSAKGQLEMLGEAKKLLMSGKAQHFWIELNDDAGSILLHPY